jgi:hypothetical protein
LKPDFVVSLGSVERSPAGARHGFVAGCDKTGYTENVSELKAGAF